MKKKNIFFLLFTIIIGFMSITGIKAEEYSGVINWREKIDGIYFNKIRDGKTISATSHYLTRSTDGEHVYCLEPGINVTNFEKYQMEETNQAKLLNITDKQWERATLLAYYGYKWGNHTDKKWYAVTQYLIWKEVSPEVEVYFTDTLGGKRVTRFENEINELNRLVDNHLKTPSFSNKTFSVGINNKIVLNDTNGVLNNYKINTNKGVNGNINGNTLNITGLKIGNSTIELIREDTRFNKNPIVYLSDLSQKVMATGKFPTIKTKINVNVLGGKIEITKYGEELKYQNNSYKYDNKLLSYVSFDIYSNEDIYNLLGELIYKKNEKVSTIKTDNNGKAVLDNLYLGKYYFIEEETTENHVLDNKKYEFTIDYKNDQTIALEKLTLYNYLPKGSLNLLKINHKGEALSGAYFEIFNSNDNLVFRGYTNENGIIRIDKLPIGNYYIKEKKAPNGYKVNKEIIDFEIKENGQVINIKAKNDLIVKVPITDKDEFPLIEVISLIFVVAGIGVLIYDKKNKRK